MSYGPSISPLIYSSSPKRTGLKWKGKNEDPYLAIQCSNSVSNLFKLYLHCVRGSGMISIHERRMALNF